MTALSPQARMLVAKARRPARLSVERRARIRTGLWAKLAVPAGLALSGSATAMGAGAMGLFSKVIVGVAAVSVGLGGTLLVHEKVEQARREERQVARTRVAEISARSVRPTAVVEAPAAPVVEPVVVAAVVAEPVRVAVGQAAPMAAVAPKPVAVTARANRVAPEEEWMPDFEPDDSHIPSPARSVAVEPAVAVEATPEIVRPVPAPVRERGPSLEGELRLLNEAQRAATEHDAEKSLAALEQYAAKFPHGNLRQEALVLKVVALCELKRSDEAKDIAAKLIELSPSAPVVLRLKASCAASAATR